MDRIKHPRPRSADRHPDPEIKRNIEARVAIRASAQAARWRFRLVAAESVVLALAVLIAGAVLDQPAMVVLRGAAIVGLGSLATGTLAIVVASAIARVSARTRARRFARKFVRAGRRRT